MAKAVKYEGPSWGDLQATYARPLTWVEFTRSDTRRPVLVQVTELTGFPDQGNDFSFSVEVTKRNGGNLSLKGWYSSRPHDIYQPVEYETR